MKYDITFEPEISVSLSSDLYHPTSVRPHALLGLAPPGPRSRRIIQTESQGIRDHIISMFIRNPISVRLYSHAISGFILEKHVFCTVFLVVYG